MRDYYRIGKNENDSIAQNWECELNSDFEFRNDRNKPKKDFKCYKKNTIKSINEVEHFLRDFNKFMKYVKLYKVLK